MPPSVRRPFIRTASIFAVGIAIACTGDLAPENRGERFSPHSANPNRMPNGDGEDNVPASQVEQGPGFAIDKGAMNLLPFDVRVRKLENATGIPKTDASFTGLILAAVELGAANNAAGIAADRSWNASRMALWVRHLKPICESGRARHLDDLATFIQNAHGRQPTSTEVEGIDDALVAEGITDEQQRQTLACIAVLSSAEFVLQ